EIHVDLGEQIPALLHVADDPRTLAHPVVGPGQEPSHAVATFERAAAAFHRAVLGEPALDQRIVVAGQEIRNIGFVIERHSRSSVIRVERRPLITGSHSSSRMTASAASVVPSVAHTVLTIPVLWARKM